MQKLASLEVYRLRQQQARGQMAQAFCMKGFFN